MNPDTFVDDYTTDGEIENSDIDEITSDEVAERNYYILTEETLSAPILRRSPRLLEQSVYCQTMSTPRSASRVHLTPVTTTQVHCRSRRRISYSTTPK
jgi:hypothetical protein